MDLSRSRPPAWRVLIAGAGIPGLALSVALARHLGPAVEVGVCDPALPSVRRDPRAYALSPGSRNFLQALGVWDRLAPAVQPITGMTITDSQVGDVVRPEYLTFDRRDAALGYMVEGERLSALLADEAARAGVTLEPSLVAGFEPEPAGLGVQLGSGQGRICHLLVAADGSRSVLRDLAGIAWYGRRYRQSGIVATVSHERDHSGRAVQHFLPSGPFAILPLPPESGRHRSSIVWTERDELVARLLALAPTDAGAELARRFGRELGAVTLETGLSAHPLSWGLARSYVAERFALLGDAAHAVHPLAGQGLNLALGDVAALAERIADAVRLGLDPGGADVLAAYERDRRFDAVALAGTTDGLNRLFSNDRLPLRVLRDLGLGLVDRSEGAKNLFAREAAGTARRAPRLMHGKAL